MTSCGTEPAVAQHLNHCANVVTYSFTVRYLNMLRDFYVCYCYSQLFLLDSQNIFPVQATYLANLRTGFLVMEEHRRKAVRDTSVVKLSIKYKD